MERCGIRLRRPIPEPEGCAGVADGDDMALTPLGDALLEALRDDERFRDIIADPFGDHGPAAA
jgi:hypothetical protein